jgi:RHS repeat-associated protein
MVRKMKPSQCTPTATAHPTKPAPEALQNAKYTYNGDGHAAPPQRSVGGNMVNDDITYYPSRAYQKDNHAGTVKVLKYYSLAGQTVAMRTITGTQDTLNWILGDHLGSTNVTASADGSFNSEMRYTAFGEMRYSLNTTPTKYRFTNQLSEASTGLYYFNARWYDPVLARFVQPDTIIPDPKNPIAYDRYAYALNNPINHTDMTGHDGGGLLGTVKNAMGLVGAATPTPTLTSASTSTATPNGSGVSLSMFEGYLFKHAKDVPSSEPNNPDVSWTGGYRDYSPNDCTSSISRALAYAGMRDNNDWGSYGFSHDFYGKNGFSSDGKLAFLNTPAFLEYLKQDYGLEPKIIYKSGEGWLPELNNVREGDFVFFFTLNSGTDPVHVAFAYGIGNSHTNKTASSNNLSPLNVPVQGSYIPLIVDRSSALDPYNKNGIDTRRSIDDITFGYETIAIVHFPWDK